MFHQVTRKSVGLLLTLAVILTVFTTVVAAAPPSAVHLEVSELIGSSGEPFTASGEAVDAGILCPSGTVDDLSVVAKGSPSAPYTILLVNKVFNCGDESGTFDVQLTVRLDNSTHYTTASWRLVGGTQAYAGLHGNGKLAGTPIVPGISIYDVYDGNVH